MRTALWKHQVHALGMMRRMPAVYLAWEMGAGKTLPTVAHIAERRPAVSLIACPKAVMSVWPREFTKHLGRHGFLVEPLSARRSGDTVATRVDYARAALRHGQLANQPVVLVTNYDSVYQKAMKEFLLALGERLGVVVLDEIHRIKSPQGKTSKFFALLASRLGPDCTRIGLSGTPMPHDPMDIWAQMRFLDPRVFGVHDGQGWRSSFVAFRNSYMRMGGYQRMTPAGPVGTQWMGFLSGGAEEDFHARCARVMHQVKKSEVLDLPETLHVEHLVKLEPKAMQHYRSMRDELIVEMEQGTCTAENALVRVVRLGQIAAGYLPTEDGHSVRVSTAKAEALADLMEDMDAAPVVVFCKFVRDLETVRAAAEKLKRRVYELSGKRDDIRGKWEPDTARSVAAVQIQSGAEGIDLTCASTCVYFTPTFDNGMFQQSLARVHRPGQLNKVTFIHLLAEGTVDVTTYKALQNRQSLIENVMALVREQEDHDGRAGSDGNEDGAWAAEEAAAQAAGDGGAGEADAGGGAREGEGHADRGRRDAYVV